MNRNFWSTEAWRWLSWLVLTVGVVAVGWPLVFLFAWAALPESVSREVASIIVEFLPIAVSGLSAPRRKAAVAAGTAVLVWIAGCVFWGLRFEGAHLWGVVGVGAALAFVMWWSNPRRRRGFTWPAFIVSLAAVSTLAGVVITAAVDWPFRPQPIPKLVSRILESDTRRVKAFREYDLGGFVDSEQLWCIDAPPEVIRKLANSLQLEPVNRIPEEFWPRSPHWWPKPPLPGAEAYQSPDFPLKQRGRDGLYFFLVYDKNKERAYVWIKNHVF